MPNMPIGTANTVSWGSGFLYRQGSSVRFKTNVNATTRGLSDVLKLRPVTFEYKDIPNTVRGGFIAEEVDALGLTEFVNYDEEKRPDGLCYGDMVSLAIKAIQDLSAKVDALEAELATLKKV